MNELQKQLFTLQDPSYLEFHSKLIPTIEKNRIIGIRTPAREFDTLKSKKVL